MRSACSRVEETGLKPQSESGRAGLIEMVFAVIETANRIESEQARSNMQIWRNVCNSVHAGGTLLSICYANELLTGKLPKEAMLWTTRTIRGL